MGLFDKLKNATGDLVADAKHKVTDVTGVDADKLVEATGSFLDAGSSVADGIGSVEEGAKH